MSTSQEEFVEFYKKASLRCETVERFERIQDLVHFYLGEDMLISRCGSLVLPAGLVQEITPYRQLIGVKHNKTGNLSE